jgi:hypothetical protein
MPIELRNSFLYLATAKALLLARKSAELLSIRIGTPSSFHAQGFTQYHNGNFVSPEHTKCHSAQLISLLDDIDARHRQNPDEVPASFTAENYSGEFISENIFYKRKLGPRLRVTYNTNNFESWPDLARLIVLSDSYQAMLKNHFGTLTGVHKCYIEKAFLNGSEPEWHVDSIAEIGRLLFFLNDVDEDNAPMEYVTKSNLDAHQAFHEIKMKHLKTAESWTPYNQINSEAEIIRLKGKAGESFFFDARGVHRSTLARTKPRYALMISFTPKTFLNWYFDLNRGAWTAGTRDLTLLPQSNSAGF